MTAEISGFYDELADFYHLIFEDWDRSINLQAVRIDKLLAPATGGSLKILDCACGIGTQSLGLAKLGHRVVGSDLSSAAVERARREALQRDLRIPFFVSDMTSLIEVTEDSFDAAIVMDNALPHLNTAQLRLAVEAIASKLRPSGLFLASIRDYDAIIQQKPTFQQPAFYGAPGNRRIVHQVWDWAAGSKETAGHVLHIYITLESEGRWHVHHFVSNYRCLLRDELSAALVDAGFRDIRWLTPAETGFYQPIVIATSGRTEL